MTSTLARLAVNALFVVSHNRQGGTIRLKRTKLSMSAETPPTASTTPPSATNTEFRFIPYGQSAASLDLCSNNNNDDDKAAPRPSSLTTISCDGRVPGTTLELTHWADNETPDDLYADTSTEIAINFAEARLYRGRYQHLDNALVLNNHYDTDGVLSVYACLFPQQALQRAELLIAGAEAGDFGEWSADDGVKLDCTLCALLELECAGDQETAYREALRNVVPDLLSDLKRTGGEKYEHSWRDEFQHAIDGWDSIQNGRTTVQLDPTGNTNIVIVQQHQQDGGSANLNHRHRRLSPYALHRGMKEFAKLDLNKVTRILRVTRLESNGNHDASHCPHGWKYEYELPGHGWVKRLVKRTVIPDVQDKDYLVQCLNQHCAGQEEEKVKDAWTTGGMGGLVSVCQTGGYVTTPPDVVLRVLAEFDNGAK